MQTFFYLAVLVEAIIEAFEMVIKDFDYKQPIAFVLGTGGSLLFDADLFALLEIPLTVSGLVASIISAVLVGVLVMRYSGAANKLLEFLKTLKP